VRSARRPVPVRGTPHLFERPGDDPASFWTAAQGDPPAVYRERTMDVDGTTVRRWDPSRSKLGAALVNGWSGALPTEGERWLYLGASTGTTASHVADLVGNGRVYAVERSVRPFARLRHLATRYPNLLPILADARRPSEYLGLVPPADGVYVDVAQADQVELALENARWFLRSSGSLLIALKTASMGREHGARQHLARAVEALHELDLDDPVDLAPYHRKHFLVGGRATRALFRGRAEDPVTARAPPARPRR
jgi:fibrillarin-like pre-rRNA processing protein